MVQVENLSKLFQELGSKLFNTYYKIDLMYWDVDHGLLEIVSRYYEILDLINDTKYKRMKDSVSVKELENCIKKY